MARYKVIELFNEDYPIFVNIEEGSDIALDTDNYNEALEQAKDCQDGFILDFEDMKIIKPD